LTAGSGRLTPVVTTDEQWRVAYGPLLEADLLMGETFDARREWPGWTSAGFAEGPEWLPVRLAEVPDAVELSPMIGPTVKATQELVPIDEPQVIKRWPQNDYVFDFGQNLVGRVRFKLKSPRGNHGSPALCRNA
jgi:alpha-L-rhamnosidase